MCTSGDLKSTFDLDVMKILHVITGLKKAAGTSVFCAEVCNGLAAAGHDVTIAVADPTRTDCYPLDPRIRLISISSLLTHPSSLLTHPSIIHIHALWSPILHKVSNWAHRNKVPVVWSPHGMLTPWAMNNKKWKKRLGWWLYQRKDLARADLLHATAESEVEDVRRMGLRNKMMIAPLGVNIGGRIEGVIDHVEQVEHVEVGAGNVKMWKRGNEETANNQLDERVDGKKVLLFVSRVQRKKGLINLARAWANLKQESSTCSTWLNSWKVRIVGPDQEGHTQEVKAECERLGIIDDWEFVGPRYGEKLQSEYANADLFVLPTYSENFGSVVIEALAHKVPVITTKGTPWSELEAEKCGKWIDLPAEGLNPPSVWSTLVSALECMMSMPDDERREMGKRGRKLVEEKYTWDAVVKMMTKGYECIA